MSLLASTSRSFRRSMDLNFKRYKYKFYEAACNTPTSPSEPIESSLMSESEREQLKKSSKRTFEGKYALDDISPEERIQRIFGGRIKGESPNSSSRIDRGEPKVIAGVLVPDKPKEPDNCCMSGCINCVWELFNDDIKDWNGKRKEAAQMLAQKGGRWPENFHAPMHYLKNDNLPLSMARSAGTLKERSQQTSKQEEEESWGQVPVAIRVFAEMEKKMKAKHKRQSDETHA